MYLLLTSLSLSLPNSAMLESFQSYFLALRNPESKQFIHHQGLFQNAFYLQNYMEVISQIKCLLNVKSQIGARWCEPAYCDICIEGPNFNVST